MSLTVITAAKPTRNGFVYDVATAACGTVTVAGQTKYRAAIDYKGKDDGKILVKIENADAGATPKVATILKGTMLQGVDDLALSMTSATGSITYVVLESGKYLQSDGTVVIDGTDANIKVAAVELP